MHLYGRAGDLVKRDVLRRDVDSETQRDSHEKPRPSPARMPRKRAIGNLCG
jgi:hypothetical protein